MFESLPLLRIIIAVIIMAFATQLTRAFPFLLFSGKEPPPWLLKGARLIPGAVMTILVISSLPINSQITLPSTWLPWAGVAATAGLHSAFRHPLISIFGGTGIYMTLLHFLG